MDHCVQLCKAVISFIELDINLSVSSCLLVPVAMDTHHICVTNVPVVNFLSMKSTVLEVQLQFK